MAREYWQTSSKRYGLPTHLYTQVIGVIRDYERLKGEYDRILNQSASPPDGQPKGNNRTDTTSEKGMECAELSKKLKAVEQARYEVPEEYREGVWANTLYGVRFPADSDRTTYYRHKKIFIKALAKKLKWI